MPAPSLTHSTPVHNDDERLAALKSYGILDTPSETVFDDMTRLIAEICHVPLAAISFVDSDRQWFKSIVGLEVRETTLDVSFCAHALQQQDLFIVPDATKDPRFELNPLVTGAMHLRFYAGALLETPSGIPIGTLCVLDQKPRDLSENQKDALRTLARHVMTQLELRRALASQTRNLEAREHLDGEMRGLLSRFEQQSRVFDTTLSAITDFAYSFDHEGRFRYANAPLLHLLGITLEQIVGKTFFELPYPPELAARLHRQILQVFESGQRLQDETEYTSPAGESGYYEYIFSPVFGPEGIVELVVGSTRDITRRKRIEAELQNANRAMLETTERLGLAIAAAELGDWKWDAQTDLMTLSQRAADIFGVSAERSVSRTSLRAMLHPDDRNVALEASARAVKECTGYDLEYRVIRPEGKMVWVAVDGRGQYDAAGQCVGMIGVLRDVTERKLVEQEREHLLQKVESERARLASAFMQSPAFMCVLRGPELVFEFVNEQYFQLVGRRDIVGKPVRQALSEVEGQGYVEILDQVYSSGLPYVGKDMAINVQRSAGAPLEQRHLEFVYQPVHDAEGAVSGIFVHGIDITDAKRVHQEREHLLASERAARSEAERASRMKDEFLATLSHELRTPLNAILGWSQILRSAPSEPEDLAQGLETIERNARAQTQIIEDLLDMSRIISGKVRLHVQRVDLTALVRSAVDTLHPAAEAKNIRLTAVLDSEASIVSGDPNRLQQIFWNLLSNAIKFTPRGGRVQVLLERINSHFEISVIDTGEGIKPEFLPYVFDRFRQADASTTRRHGGLGLGLAIVKQLAELHGGSVCAKSLGAGTGSTFTVSLPLTVIHPEPESDVERRHPDRPPQVAVPSNSCVKIAGVKVLVVDDEPDARALVQRLLEDCEAIVITAGSADEAVARVAADRPDVMVSDIGMPGEDGYSLMRRVRALGPARGGSVPAIALTAYARSEDRMRSVLAGFQMHIAKPVEPAELLTMVASLAQRMT